MASRTAIGCGPALVGVAPPAGSEAQAVIAPPAEQLSCIRATLDQARLLLDSMAETLAALENRMPLPPKVRPEPKSALGGEWRQFSPTRDAIIRRDWPAGRHVNQILTELNAQPGPPVERKRIAVRAGYLKVRRPIGFYLGKDLEEENLPADPNDYEPAEADFEQISGWAFTHGAQFRNWDDLPLVNQVRERIGVPIFKRKFRR